MEIQIRTAKIKNEKKNCPRIEEYKMKALEHSH